MDRSQIKIRRLSFAELDIEERMWCDDLTKWEFTLPEEVIHFAHSQVAKKIDEVFDYMTHRGLAGCPSLGEYCDEYSWIDVHKKGSLIHSAGRKPKKGRPKKSNGGF